MRSCHTPGQRARLAGQTRLRVTDGPKSSVNWALSTQHVKTGLRHPARRNLRCETDRKATSSKAQWSAKSTTRHIGRPGHPLHPTPSPVVLTMSCYWTRWLWAREWGRRVARILLTLNKVYSASHSSTPKPIGLMNGHRRARRTNYTYYIPSIVTIASINTSLKNIYCYYCLNEHFITYYIPSFVTIVWITNSFHNL